MDGLFYRKDRKRFDLRGKAGKLFGNKRRVLMVAAGTILVLYVTVGDHGIVQRIRLQQQKAELTEKIRQAEEETRRLQAEAKALDGDPKAIEKVAREKYGMIREGETVYKVNRK